MKISLKYKILFFLTVIPALGLGFYVWLAATLFRSDKEAYVYSSTATISRAISAQIASELRTRIDATLSFVAQFEPVSATYKSDVNTLFAKQNQLTYLSFNQVNENGEVAESGVVQSELAKKDLNGLKKFKDDLVKKAYKDGIAIDRPESASGYLGIAILDKNSTNKIVLFLVTPADDLIKAISGSETVATYMVSGNGKIILRPSGYDFLSTDIQQVNYFLEQQWGEFSEGSSEYVSDNVAVLASYSKVGLGNIRVLSLVDKNRAFLGVRNLIIKSIYCLVMLLSVTLLISLLTSNGLTTPLRHLYEATREIAKGKFDIKLEVTSSDEVGGLSDSFNHMTKEVSRLMLESVEKARMAGELATARTVQETLFPEANARIGNLEIYGHYEPASECGGDWWHYGEIGRFVFFWIGDATGHGAAAALITSAARSAAAVIENFSDITPGQVLTLVNNSIHSTSKGRMMMTFFLAAIDKNTGEVAYSNASHDPPFLLRSKRPLTKGDIEFLDAIKGPRLGHVFNSNYSEATTVLNDGDMLLLYTDGVPEMVSSDQKPWGERRYLKAVIQAAESTSTNDFFSSLKSQIGAYRQDASLKDDVTFVVVKFKQSSESAAA